MSVGITKGFRGVGVGVSAIDIGVAVDSVKVFGVGVSAIGIGVAIDSVGTIG